MADAAQQSHPEYLASVLGWYVENGVDESLQNEPRNWLAPAPRSGGGRPESDRGPVIGTIGGGAVGGGPAAPSVFIPPGAGASQGRSTMPLGTLEAKEQAIALAKAANSLDELRAAIGGFDGLAIRKTATNLVFADGNPQARVMVIGEAPGGDEDLQGKPFVGVSGQLMDKMLACIGLSRTSDDPKSSVYISNILNWRPPGNRTPTPAEMEISLPFIERHIALVRPQVLLFMGATPTKALLGTEDGITKLRGKWQVYRPRTEGFDPLEIKALPSYHPSFLLRTPLRKKESWVDMLLLSKEI